MMEKFKGYKMEPLQDSIIAEPEDWTEEQWKTLCRFFALDPIKTVRFSIHGINGDYIEKGD